MIEIIIYKSNIEVKFLIGFRDHINMQAGYLHWFTGNKLSNKKFAGSLSTWESLYDSFTYPYITLFNWEVL